MHKVMILSGSRADYGLLDPLITKCQEHFEVQLVVTGSHLSHEFGYTVKDIKHPVAERVEIVLSSDTPVGISKSMGLACISFGEVFDRLKPDLLIVLGDRYEIFAAVSAAHVANVPVCHIHGGEITEGSQDDVWRHSITKMSQLHFPCAEEYRDRIIRLGERPDVVFNVGALGCEGLSKRAENRPAARCVLAYYPTTTGRQPADAYAVIEGLSLQRLKVTNIKSNPDVNASFRDQHGNDPFVVYSRPEFLDVLRASMVIVGNSSSGVIEAPALGIPTINVGTRQTGRLMADSIIQADPTKESISAAFDKLYSQEFRDLMKTEYYQPYKGGAVAEKIVRIIKERMPVSVKKRFYDG